MKKTFLKVSIIFIVALSIVSGLSGSSIGMGAPVNAVQTQAQTVKTNELSEIKRPDTSLKLLKAGNERFQKNKTLKFDVSNAKRESLVNGQNPSAVIITCSDSRVPPELIFDQGLGDIFVIRVAGNVMDKIELGSVEYAVEHLHTPLIVVMGHEHCGAVGAAVENDGKEDQGNIEAIIDKIEPSVEKVKSKNLQGEELIEAVSDENIKNSTLEIKKSKVIQKELQKGNIKVVEAKYMLQSGKVKWIND